MNFIKDNKQWRWNIHRNLATMDFDFYWITTGHHQHTFKRLIDTVTEQKIDPDEIVSLPSPTLSLSSDEAQTMMDELWQAGLRPTNVGDPVARIQQYKDEVNWLRKHIEVLANAANKK